MQIKWVGRFCGIAPLLSVFFLSGCLQTQPYKTKSALIVWKTPSFRYADMGFVSDDGNSMKVEIYGVGAALMHLKIGDDMICMSRFECMSKKNFTRKYLSLHYSDEILENIFRGKPIFAGAGLIQKRNGFTQKIEKFQTYQIEYSVLNNQTIFRDRINKILIKVSVQ